MDEEHPVTELWQVMNGDLMDRTDQEQITVLESVGFAIEDISALRLVYEQLASTGQVHQLDMVASPEDLSDLFGMVMNAADAGVHRSYG